MEFIDAREALKLLIEQNEKLIDLEIAISSKALKNEEAIGHPDRDDFPLLRGKEVLLQAEVDGSLGQAFTSDPIAYRGSLRSIMDLPTDRPGNYALMVAAVNAVGKNLGIVSNTIHCLNNEPEECATRISKELFEKHGPSKIGIIGFQPAIIENCVKVFGAENIRVTDLSADIVGTVRYGVKIMDGLTDTKKLAEAVDFLLITGSILANGTAPAVLDDIGDTDCYFFGTTCAALAHINDFKRVCPLSK